METDFRILSVKPGDLLLIRVKNDTHLTTDDISSLGKKVRDIMDGIHGQGAVKIMMVSDDFSFDVIRGENESKTDIDQ